MSELERSLVQDVRIRNITRTRGSDQQVSIKIKGEARSPEAEANFIEALQANAYFFPLILDREAERQGGGLEFEIMIGISQTPPPYEPLPKYGPTKEMMQAKANASASNLPPKVPPVKKAESVKQTRPPRIKPPERKAAIPSEPSPDDAQTSETPPKTPESVPMRIRPFRSGRRAFGSRGKRGSPPLETRPKSPDDEVEQ